MQNTSAREQLTRHVNHLKRLMTNHIAVLFNDLLHSCGRDQQIYERLADYVATRYFYCFAGGCLFTAFVFGVWGAL